MAKRLRKWLGNDAAVHPTHLNPQNPSITIKSLPFQAKLTIRNEPSFGHGHSIGRVVALQLEPVVFDTRDRFRLQLQLRLSVAVLVVVHQTAAVDAIILGCCIFYVQLPTLKIDMRRFGESLVVSVHV